MKFFEHALLAFMIHDMGDMVAHVKRTCRITRENLRPDMFEMVKQNILDCTAHREVIKDITSQSLNRVSKFFRRSVLLQSDIHFSHAADRIV